MGASGGYAPSHLTHQTNREELQLSDLGASSPSPVVSKIERI